MQSWRLLKHSINMVMNNFSVAMKLAVPLIGAMVLSLVFFGQDVFISDTDFSFDADPNYDPTIAVQSGVAGLLQTIAALWVAVSWHRYILLEEMPSGLIPTFHGSRILAYFGWGLVLVVIFAVIIMLISMIGGLMFALGTLGGLIGTAIIVAGGLLVFYLAARLYVILPSAAIGKTLRISEAWEATRGYGTSIIFAYVLFVIFAIVVSIIAGIIASLVGLVGVLLMMGLNLVLVMIGMSFLTTIYGVTVENRDI